MFPMRDKAGKSNNQTRMAGFATSWVAQLAAFAAASAFLFNLRVSIGHALFSAVLNAVIIGLLAGSISYWACSVLKPKFGYDDALDTFGVHGIGGTIGALATALLMDGAVNEAGGKLVAKGLLMGQLTAMLLCIVVSLVMTWIIAKLVAVTIGLRPSEEAEAQGLDIADHGEEGYNAN